MVFLQWFTETQMFEVYITERENETSVRSGKYWQHLPTRHLNYPIPARERSYGSDAFVCFLSDRSLELWEDLRLILEPGLGNFDPTALATDLVCTGKQDMNSICNL